MKGAPIEVLRGGIVQALYQLKGEGKSIRAIARTLGISRNTVRRYLRADGVPGPRPRPSRGSKLDPYIEHVDRRLSDGLFNCVVLLRELRELGYQGSYTVLKDYVKPRRLPRQPKATLRFETKPGEQAQVDWGSLTYVSRDGSRRRRWAFVMVMGYSRAIYLEIARRADVATFIACHLNAFEYFGGIPKRCLYDNAKVVVLGRDANGDPEWNRRMLDFSLRLGFKPQLCKPYRAQTKGKVENAIKYVKGNFWPAVRFANQQDLNRQAIAWCDGIANVRIHGTTGKMPAELLDQERPELLALPDRRTLAPYRRRDRKVSRDGFVSFEGSRYGVPWRFAEQMVQVSAGPEVLEVWDGEQRLALHPRSEVKGERLILPGQWEGLPAAGSNRPQPRAIATQVAGGQVEQRSLAVYEQLSGGAS